MRTIRIDKKTGFAYIPKDIRDEGYSGNVEIMSNSSALVIFNPGTTTETIVKSLRIMQQDLQLHSYKNNV